MTFAHNARMGFAKLAFVDDLRDEDAPEESHTLRNLTMAGAAVAPWAGVIGEAPMLHHGKGPEMSLAAFKKQMRAGDILLQGDRAVDPFKIFGGISTGNAPAFHAEVVGHKGWVYGAGGAGMGSSHLRSFNPRNTRLQLLRPKLSPAQINEQLRNLEQGAQTSDVYREQLEKKLVRAGVAPSLREKLLRAGGGGTYNTYDVAGSALKNLFVPKLETAAAIEAERQMTLKGRAAFNVNKGGVADTAAQAGVDRLDRFKALKGLPQSSAIFQSQVTPQCIGSACTTYTAQTLPKGKLVVPGKLPSEILGADYLRSELYEPVARHGFNRAPPLHERFMPYAPTAARLGAGALLAGGVYAGAKALGWYKRRHERQHAHQPPVVTTPETEEMQTAEYTKGAEVALDLFR